MPSTDPSFNADPAPDDLRASLVAEFDAAEQTEIPEPGEAARPPEADETAAVPAAESSATIKEDHPTDPKRYADGSFKPLKKEESAETAATPDKDLPSKDTQTQASVAAQTASAPPAGWTAAEKAEWSKLSPVAQAAVSRRETEIANGGKQWSEEKRRYEAMIAPVAESARVRGMTAEAGLQTLVAAQRALDTDPVSAIKHIARSYGVDLATLAGTQAANGSPEQVQQPDIAMLVQRAVAPMLAPIQQRFTAEDQARNNATMSLVDKFAASPGHEHYSVLEPLIVDLIPHVQNANPEMSKEQVLQEAYDRALYARPDTRAAVLAAKEAEKEAARLEAAKQRTHAARRASVSVTGAPTGVPAAEAKDSLRAELEAAWAGA